MEPVTITFIGFPHLPFKVYMIAWGIKTFWEQSLHDVFLLNKAYLTCRLQQWNSGQKGKRDFLFSSGGVTKVSAASGKGCTLKSLWKWGWEGIFIIIHNARECIYLTLSQSMLDHVVLFWSLLTSYHLRNLASLEIFFGTLFGKAGGIYKSLCGLSSKYNWCWLFPACTQE